MPLQFRIRTRRVLALMVTAAAAMTLHAFQRSPANRSWPPEVQKVSNDSPALTPGEALKTFYMPPGYYLELVAAEPLVQDPIAMDWDPDGRLWVVEMPGFVPTLETPEPNMAPIGRVVVLEDTNDDGRMDKRTVFADGLVLARAVKVLDNGVLVGEPPNAWLMHDTNGDLRADKRESITDLYGRREGRVEQNANGFYWAMDNRMYTANGDVQLRLKDGRFEVQKALMRGEWGATQDDAGRVYRNTNSEALHVDLVPTSYYGRNPNLLRTRGSYDTMSPPETDTSSLNQVWPVRPNPGTNRSYQFGILRGDGTLASFTSVCAPLVYRGDRLPAELYGNVFVAEPAANLVSRLIVSDDGRTLRARKAYPRGEFLASTDERFRPVFITNAPDGTLYILDMYRGIIQQRADITEYLRAQILSRKLENPIGLGRLYRVMHESTRRDRKPTLSKATPAQLVQTLSHPNGWRRDTAQQLLVQRGDKTVAASLKALAASAKDARTRLHALWTLDGNDSIDPPTVLKALADPARDVRVSAIRIAERWLGDTPNREVQAAVLARMDDANWAVREQLAASLGALAAADREAAVAAILEKYADDPVVVDAALSGIRGVEANVLDRVVRGGSARTPQRDAALTMLAATVVRTGQDGAVQQVFARIADDSLAPWQRSALIAGAEVALVGATMPGTPARRAGPPLQSGVTAPCPTCPGGRAGPGGAYAFPQVPQPARGGGPRVRVNREPASLTALAARGGEYGTRLGGVLARVDWPGKPGAPAPVAPLTAEEQRRFEAGAEIYKNVCQACHQADGRGQEKLAANLIGSALALAPADVTARILLNGKEGPVGLMPPVGSVLSDDQIAAVLTYIRREWGQTGAPVDSAAVKSVRALTAGRTRPWTHDELMAMLVGR